jgi:hypothetical protein
MCFIIIIKANGGNKYRQRLRKWIFSRGYNDEIIDAPSPQDPPPKYEA